jgi:hypothetical protein
MAPETSVTSPAVADRLAALWQEVLDLPLAPDPAENFFDLGGDSLMAVRLAARAREEGLDLSARAVLEAQTVEALAARTVAAPAPAGAEAGAPEETVPLLPAQLRWLDGEIPDRDFWNLDVLLECPAGVTAGHLRSAARALLEHHEALALRYVGERTATRAERVSVEQAVSQAVEHRPLPEDQEALESVLTEAHRSLSLADGPIFRLVHLDGGDRPGRLFVLVHHLTADGVSMTVLVDDLERALRAALDGTPVVLPAPSARPGAIAREARRWAATDEARADAARWRALPWSEVRPLPAERTGPDTLDTTRVARARLDSGRTRALVRGGLGARVSVQDAMLACVLGAIAEWSDSPAQLVDVYAHGRDDVPGGLDAARTIGYVQSTFPAIVRWDARTGAREAVLAACEQLAALPRHRYGFDALRYAGDDLGLGDLPAAQLRCNFRGGLARVLERRGALLAEAPEDTVLNRSTRQRERYRLMIEGDLVDGELLVGIKFSDGRDAPDTVRAIVERSVGLLGAAVDATP